MPPAAGDARLPQASLHLLLGEGVGEASAASPPGSVASNTVASGPLTEQPGSHSWDF